MKLTKIIVATLLSLIAIQAYAIQVNVTSSSSDVAALGYEYNGSKYGKAGKAYSNDTPPGIYIFGMRVGGLLGTDVRCYDSKGKYLLKLNKNTNAYLFYQNNRCRVKLS